MATTGTDARAVRPPASRSRRAVVYTVLAVFAAACAFGWGYVMWTSTGKTEVYDQLIAFDLGPGNQVTVVFEVTKPADRAAACRLRAQDTTHAEVGTREVEIPAGKSTYRMTERVLTTVPPATGHVDHCYLK
ncbi:DUF4307 domain-containing protein [Bailinhaonella thermotolerans]|uniref:DUF4307 domain-containing protein n=1 Tax=Bailinhaonella thermotolerans TaxID=1070861 RepID=A0A3A4ATL8_9ACTN|nr:DUF4307 domain-containing protein [Bailinhaonella thermotolerans]RJL33330.1 DUF4307 domain-containing protein [Bailinhaonella thermotolerans]